MYASTRRIRALVLAALAGSAILLGTGQAQAQYGYYSPGYNSWGTYSPGYYGNAGIFNPIGYNALGGYGGYGWNGYGLDVSGWGSGYGTGWGFGYVNPYLTYGAGYGAYGQSPYSLATMRAQQYGLNAASYNLMNAQAALAYQAANAYEAQAADLARAHTLPSKTIEAGPGKPGKPGTKVIEGEQKKPPEQLMPLDQLVDTQGHVRWPAALSTVQDRESRPELEAAVETSVAEYRRNGVAAVQTVVDARHRLAMFAQPVLEQLRASSPADAEGASLFLRSLDSALYTMAFKSPIAPGRIDVTPDAARPEAKEGEGATQKKSDDAGAKSEKEASPK